MHAEGANVVIPRRTKRKALIDYDKVRYKGHWRIEEAFCRLKEFRRVACRHDKHARNFLAADALATRVAFWI